MTDGIAVAGINATDKENIAPSIINQTAIFSFPSAVAADPLPVPAGTTDVSITKDWDDLDAEDHEDPLMVSEYVVEIFSYMRQLEVSMQISIKSSSDHELLCSMKSRRLATTWKRKKN